MRPPEFTGGNQSGSPSGQMVAPASMRPPEFTGGNEHLLQVADLIDDRLQ